MVPGDQQTRERARALRKNATEAELILWHHIRRRQLSGHRFRRQHPIGPYIVDFYCYEKQLIVEVDGGQHSTQREYDEQRTLWLKQNGFRVLRFWNHDVMNRCEVVLEAIHEALEQNPHP
ncbi:MAG: endonuclease domain-containing protein [Chloroflexi bacterium]|nr:endonuclease domain-containing protein [Chloroflexota bacterium]